MTIPSWLAGIAVVLLFGSMFFRFGYDLGARDTERRYVKLLKG